MSGENRGRIGLIFSLRHGFLASIKLAELIFFPSFCEICSSLLESPDDKIVCHSCLHSIKLPRTSYCSRCGRFFDSLGDPHLCSRCAQKPPSFSAHYSSGRYQGILKDVILLFKYRKFSILGKELARLALNNLTNKREFFSGLEIVVPVPLHSIKKKQRGFNQAETIAREIAKQLNTDYVKDALVKKKNTPPQTSLLAEERRQSIKNAFDLKKRERIEGKIVLLVDDVYTTGSTLQECSRVLIQGGAQDVRALTLAQA